MGEKVKRKCGGGNGRKGGGRGRALSAMDETNRGRGRALATTGGVMEWVVCWGVFLGVQKKSDKSFLIGLVVGGGNLLSHTRVQYHWRGRA